MNAPPHSNPDPAVAPLLPQHQTLVDEFRANATDRASHRPLAPPPTNRNRHSLTLTICLLFTKGEDDVSQSTGRVAFAGFKDRNVLGSTRRGDDTLMVKDQMRIRAFNAALFLAARGHQPLAAERSRDG